MTAKKHGEKLKAQNIYRVAMKLALSENVRPQSIDSVQTKSPP